MNHSIRATSTAAGATVQVRHSPRLRQNIRSWALARQRSKPGSETGSTIRPTPQKQQQTHSAVMENGQPVMVYHGTDAQFEAFDPRKADKQALYGPGFYFTEMKELADTYQDKNKLATVFLDRPRVSALEDWVSLHLPPNWSMERASRIGDGAPAKGTATFVEGQRLSSGHYGDGQVLSISFNGNSVRTGPDGKPITERGEYLDLDNCAALPKQIGWDTETAAAFRAQVAKLSPPPAASHTISAYLNIRNPFDVNAPVSDALIAKADAVMTKGGYNRPGYDNFTHMIGSQLPHSGDELFRSISARARADKDDPGEGTVNILQAIGFDGLKYQGGIGGGVKHQVWVAWKPVQIKGTDNRGTFDPRTADYKKDWNEADHPRGQPGNAGEFGSGGGAGTLGSSANQAMIALSSEHGTQALVEWQRSMLEKEKALPDFSKYSLRQPDDALYINEAGAFVAGDDVRMAAKGAVSRDVGALMKGKCTELQAAALADALNMGRRYSGQSNYERAADGMVDLWHHTSGDSDYRAIAVQQRAQEVLGTTGAWIPPLDPQSTPAELQVRVANTADRSREFKEANTPAIDAFIRATYENTQAKLAAAGIDKVTLYRGMQFDLETDKSAKALSETGRWLIIGNGAYQRGVHVTDEAALQQMPVSSYSTNIHKAWEFGRPPYDEEGSAFAGCLLGTVVPREQIFSTATTGPGCLIENEVLVIHSDKMRAKSMMLYGNHNNGRLDPFVESPEWAGSQFWKEANAK